MLRRRCIHVRASSLTVAFGAVSHLKARGDKPCSRATTPPSGVTITGSSVSGLAELEGVGVADVPDRFPACRRARALRPVPRCSLQSPTAQASTAIRAARLDRTLAYFLTVARSPTAAPQWGCPTPDAGARQGQGRRADDRVRATAPTIPTLSSGSTSRAGIRCSKCYERDWAGPTVEGRREPRFWAESPHCGRTADVQAVRRARGLPGRGPAVLRRCAPSGCARPNTPTRRCAICCGHLEPPGPAPLGGEPAAGPGGDCDAAEVDARQMAASTSRQPSTLR